MKLRMSLALRVFAIVFRESSLTHISTKKTRTHVTSRRPLTLQLSEQFCRKLQNFATC